MPDAHLLENQHFDADGPGAEPLRSMCNRMVIANLLERLAGTDAKFSQQHWGVIDTPAVRNEHGGVKVWRRVRVKSSAAQTRHTCYILDQCFNHHHVSWWLVIG